MGEALSRTKVRSYAMKAHKKTGKPKLPRPSLHGGLPDYSRSATPARSSSSSARVMSMYFFEKSSIGRSLTML